MTPKITQVFVLFAVLSGFVFLTVRGVDTTAYLSLTAPILGAVFVASRLDQRSDAQDEKLAQISHQTNGVLTERIQKAVAKALDERDGRDEKSPF